MKSADPPHFVERIVAARRTTPGESPPLLVMLHGIGANENDLVSIAGHLDPRLTVVSLRAPRIYYTGYSWFHIDWEADGTVVPNVEQARETLADLVRWLGSAPERLGTDPKRLYLLGFSQGAMMSLGVLRAVPERLAGVIALSGRWSERLFDAPGAADAVTRIPLFVGHGTHDDVLPVANGRATRDVFQPTMRDFTYHEYPIGHGIGAEEIQDVATWLATRLDRR